MILEIILDRQLSFCSRSHKTRKYFSESSVFVFCIYSRTKVFFTLNFHSHKVSVFTRKISSNHNWNEIIAEEKLQFLLLHVSKSRIFILHQVVAFLSKYFTLSSKTKQIFQYRRKKIFSDKSGSPPFRHQLSRENIFDWHEIVKIEKRFDDLHTKESRREIFVTQHTMKRRKLTNTTKNNGNSRLNQHKAKVVERKSLSEQQSISFFSRLSPT